MKRKSLAIGSVALVHFTASVVMVPLANETFQRWFDLGYKLSRLETWNLWISRVISFPIIIWTFFLHPARINTLIWLALAVMNSLLWALVISMVIRKGRTTPALC